MKLLYTNTPKAVTALHTARVLLDIYEITWGTLQRTEPHEHVLARLMVHNTRAALAAELYSLDPAQDPLTVEYLLEQPRNLGMQLDRLIESL